MRAARLARRRREDDARRGLDGDGGEHARETEHDEESDPLH
jgi:hypothetical protein